MDAYFVFLFLMWPLAANVNSEFGHCGGKIFNRKEYRDMNSQEWNVFRNAMLQLQLQNSSDHGNYSEWDRMTKLHIDNGASYHKYLWINFYKNTDIL